MEDECIGDHGHGHAPRLSSLVVRLAKYARNLRAELTSVVMSTSEVLSRKPHAVLKLHGKRLDPRGRNGGPMHEHRQVAHAAAYPSLRRQAFGQTSGAACVERVFQPLRVTYRIAQHEAVERVDDGRVNQRDHRFYLATCTGDYAAQPCLGVILGARMIAAFSLNDDGPTARFLDEDVGATPSYEHVACLLASRLPTSAQHAQNLSQGDVQGMFVRGTRHDGILLQ